MASNESPLALTEEDAMKLVVCEAHIGNSGVDFQAGQYVWKRRNDGVHIINIRKTWDKLYLAARAIAAIENPADVCVITARTYAQRALLKFAAHTGATPICGRFTPGSLTNQIQKNFKEPRLIVISDPRVDHQAVTEASYVNIPVIGFCNTDSPLKFIDIAIPCNTKGQYSIGLMWWLLAREVLVLREKINRQIGFVVDDKVIMPDLYFYRDPLEVQEKEEAEGHVQEQAWATTHEPKDEYGQIGAADDAMKLDFQVPRIDDWGAASTWEQPAAAAAPQEAAAPAAVATGEEWGAGGTSW